MPFHDQFVIVSFREIEFFVRQIIAGEFQMWRLLKGISRSAEPVGKEIPVQNNSGLAGREIGRRNGQMMQIQAGNVVNRAVGSAANIGKIFQTFG